ncbi:hypothetical protein ACHAWF_008100 [Thalassiosira exigua]
MKYGGRWPPTFIPHSTSHRPRPRPLVEFEGRARSSRGQQSDVRRCQPLIALNPRPRPLAAIGTRNGRVRSPLAPRQCWEWEQLLEAEDGARIRHPRDMDASTPSAVDRCRCPGGAIAVFAKCPIPGASKTRLAPMLGDEGAASLAKAMLSDVLVSVSGCVSAECWPVLASIGWVTARRVRPFAPPPHVIMHDPLRALDLD